MGLFKKKKKKFLFTSKLYLTTLPYIKGFDDGYLVTIFDPSVDYLMMLENFMFELWSYTKKSLLIDLALVSKDLSNSKARFVRFAITNSGEALFDSPVFVEGGVSEMTYKAANQVLKERIKDCVKAGFTSLEINELPSDWFKIY